jgi:Fe-S-cluster containining protein
VSRARDPDAALAALAALRDSLRGAGNRERAGLFSCSGCVAWCCREGSNAMRAGPLEADAVVRLLEGRGDLPAALDRCAEAVERWRLDGEPGSRRTYTCPFLTAGNLCDVHDAKPLGCVTFTPVRDGGCDQDARRLGEALERASGAGRGLLGASTPDLPLPLAVLAAAERRRRGATSASRAPGSSRGSTRGGRGRA